MAIGAQLSWLIIAKGGLTNLYDHGKTGPSPANTAYDNQTQGDGASNISQMDIGAGRQDDA